MHASRHWRLLILHSWPPLLTPQVYPLPSPSTEADEQALTATRLELHALLGLPPNRPLLRVANAVDFSAAAAAAAADKGRGGGSGGRLSDVHVGLAPSGVGGTVHLVQGSYDYYHYMQVVPDYYLSFASCGPSGGWLPDA